ncbi:hypothetical protein SAMN05414139_01235 [Burkholderia sp. D7]|nr:hypothetical protein SAMN05414139_01235 [Burkholderia sp. D7]
MSSNAISSRYSFRHPPAFNGQQASLQQCAFGLYIESPVSCISKAAVRGLGFATEKTGRVRPIAALRGSSYVCPVHEAAHGQKEQVAAVG